MVDFNEVIALARTQFGATALYHFLFVPLTLGLSTLVAIMETIYVRTGNTAWRDGAKFWGLLFGINFAMGVATGIPMEFQFGMIFQRYANFVGDIFGAPLAIEGLMAFFLEATFIGMWFFGWDKLSKRAHCTVGWLMALGATFSAIWILVANGFMQYPVGGEINPFTNRAEMVNFFALILSPVAQVKFAHTISSGYVCGAVFVLAISAYYLLRKRNIGFAKRSMTIASSFGLLAIFFNVWMGHQSGDLVNQLQPTKMAATEAACKAEEGPANFNAIGIIVEDIKNGGECEFKGLTIPNVLGMITMSTWEYGGKVFSVEEIRDVNKTRILSGVEAVRAQKAINGRYRQTLIEKDTQAREALEKEWAIFKENAKQAGQLSFGTLALSLKGDNKAQQEYSHQQETLLKGLSDPDMIKWATNKYHYGYGLLLYKYIDVINADDMEISKAVPMAINDSVPSIAPNFYAFRIMVGLGLLMILFFIVSFVKARRNTLTSCRKYLVWAFLMLPAPWIAIESGWLLAEYGRQPWAIQDLLPTFYSVSNHPVWYLWLSLSLFVILYASLMVVEIYLMLKYIKLGPEGTQLDKKSA